MFWKAFVNKNVPICLKCKHFLKHVNDTVPSDILYGRCNKFRKDNALTCRSDQNKCGLFGSYFSSIKN